MSGVINPEYTSYLKIVRSLPLSETISEAQQLFNNDLKLFSKSEELVKEVTSNRNDFSVGKIIGYRDIQEEKLFIYLGLVYQEDGIGRAFPSTLYFGTDIESGKLEEFTSRILTGEKYYPNRKNVINLSWSQERSMKSPLLSCVESHKARKKGLYDELSNLPFNSSIENFKQILDK